MDCAIAGVAPQVDFALVGHPETWSAAAEVFSALRGPERTPLPDDELRDILPWIPPRAVCRVEVKSIAALDAVHSKQVLTYLRLMDKRLGLLINFGEHMIKHGIKRIANGMPEEPLVL